MATSQRSATQVMTGAVLALLGAGGIVGLIALLNCGSDTCETWAVRLGLAMTLVISALAQLMLIFGLWLLWRAFRPPGDTSDA